MEHVRDDLSAYLDGALLSERRSAVEAHLATCPQCGTALADLRSTARLIAALPGAVPSRRLVPALAPRTSWLRPLRSLSAVAAGTFLLVFMASATLDTGFRMGGGGAKATSGRLIGGPTPAAAPFESRSGPVAGAASSAVPQRAATEVAPSPAPRADQLSGATTETQPAADVVEPPRLGTPWLWLGLALLSAALAALAHRRLRTP